MRVPLPLDKAVERRMGELNTKRKIRDNAVRAMGFIVSSNDALEEDMSPVTLASEAREAARAFNARRGNVPQRDRGQSR